MNPEDLLKAITPQPAKPTTPCWVWATLAVAITLTLVLAIALIALASASHQQAQAATESAYRAGYYQAVAETQNTIVQLKQEISTRNADLNTLRGQLNYLTEQAAQNAAALNAIRQQASSYVSYTTNAPTPPATDPYALTATSGNVTIILSSAGVGLYVATNQGGQP
jgi:septal ring factor EnvC (AmiA/AmiB activator)